MAKIQLFIFFILILVGIFYAARQLYYISSERKSVAKEEIRFNVSTTGYRCGDGTEFSVYSAYDAKNIQLVPATSVERIQKTILSRQGGSSTNATYEGDGVRLEMSGNTAMLSMKDFIATCTEMPNSLRCHDSPRYFVVEKSLADIVGSDILIKYKTSSDQNIDCEYRVANGDFELKNALAEYFFTFTDNFLVLDKGTAPEPRELVVYDLRSREMVFTDSYAKPVAVEGDSITYFSKTATKPTAENCAELDKYTENGLGAAIMSKVTVDLSSLAKKDAGETKCVAVQ